MLPGACMEVLLLLPEHPHTKPKSTYSTMILDPPAAVDEVVEGEDAAVEAVVVAHEATTHLAATRPKTRIQTNPKHHQRPPTSPNFPTQQRPNRHHQM